MAFFTADFSETSLHSAWTRHAYELRAQQFQSHNDYLYEVIKASILARREMHYNDLLLLANISSSPRDLCTILWSYRTARYMQPRHTLDPVLVDETEELLDRKGYEWCVGVVTKSGEHDTFDPEDFDTRWRWQNREPVHNVVCYTDVLQRIALLFGEDRFRVSYRVTTEKVLDAPVKVLLQKVELLLHYHPGGLYGGVREALQRTAEKYQHYYEMTPSYAWIQPYVWKGARQDEPGLSNASPPPLPPPDSPPRLARRSKARAVSQKDVREAARRLSYGDAE